MIERTTLSLKHQLERLLPCVPYKRTASFCLRRLGWLDKKELAEVLEIINDYFLALHEAADLEAQTAGKTKDCLAALKGAARDWVDIRHIFKNARKPKK